MWVFYALAGPIALGMVVATLQYFAASTVPLHARWIVGYAWFCTISIIILVPADIWSVRKNTHHHHHYPLLLRRPHPSLQFPSLPPPISLCNSLLRYPPSLCNFPFLLSPSLCAIPFSVIPISLQFPSLLPPISLWNFLLCCSRLFLQFPSLLPPISVSVSVPSLLVVEIFSLCKSCRWYCLCFCGEFLSLESQPYGSACLLAEHPKKNLGGVLWMHADCIPREWKLKNHWHFVELVILEHFHSHLVCVWHGVFSLLVVSSHGS